MNSDIECNVKVLLRGNASDKEFINFINNSTKKKPERKKRWDRQKISKPLGGIRRRQNFDISIRVVHMGYLFFRS